MRAIRSVLVALAAATASIVGGAGPAQAQVTDQFPLVDVDTNAIQGGVVGIRLGAADGTDHFYPASTTGGTDRRLQLLIIDRQTLDPATADSRTITCATLGAACLNQLASPIVNNDDSRLVIIAAQPGFGEWVSLSLALPLIGVEQVSFDWTAGPTFSAIGVPGWSAGAATWRAGQSGRLTGYMVPNDDDNYTYLSPQRPRYSFAADGSTLTLGSHTYTAAPATGSGTVNGGFHVWVFNQLTLDPIEIGGVGESFSTNQTDNSDAAGAALALADRIRNAAPGELVFVHSFGNPVNYSDTGDWNQLAQALQTAGGLQHTLDTIGDGPYALVGWAGAGVGAGQESSTLRNGGVAGQLTGVLRPAHDSQLRPALPDPSGEATYAIYDALFSPPTAWPMTDTPGRQAAYAYLSSHVHSANGGNDLRANYYKQDAWDWGSVLSELYALRGGPTPAGAFTATDFTDVATQLIAEVGYVQAVRTYLLGNGSSLGLRSPFADAQLDDWSTLTSVANRVQTQVDAPSSSNASLYVSDVIQGLFAVGGFVPEIGPVIGSLGAIYSTGMSIAQDASGQPVDTRMQDTTTNLQSRLATGMRETTNNFDELADIVVSDWGRLSYLGSRAGCATSSCAEFAWTASTRRAAWSALTNSTEATFWKALMPVVYDSVDLGADPRLTSANEAYCSGTTSRRPYANAAATGQAVLNVGPAAFGAPSARRRVLVLAKGHHYAEEATVPAASVTNRIFGPPDPGGNPLRGGLGIDRNAALQTWWTPDPIDRCAGVIESTGPGGASIPLTPVPPASDEPAPSGPTSAPGPPVTPAPVLAVSDKAPGRTRSAPLGSPVRVHFDTTRPGTVELRIYQGGRVVASERARARAGHGQISWDGRRDRDRRRLAPGLYRVELVLRGDDGRVERTTTHVRITARR